jgi:hypothetical protein
MTEKTLKSEDLDQFIGSENMRGWQSKSGLFEKDRVYGFPAGHGCEKSTQAGRVIGRSLFVRVSVVWRTNLEVTPLGPTELQMLAKPGNSA